MKTFIKDIWSKILSLKYLIMYFILLSTFIFIGIDLAVLYGNMNLLIIYIIMCVIILMGTPIIIINLKNNNFKITKLFIVITCFIVGNIILFKDTIKTSLLNSLLLLSLLLVPIILIFSFYRLVKMRFKKISLTKIIFSKIINILEFIFYIPINITKIIIIFILFVWKEISYSKLYKNFINTKKEDEYKDHIKAIGLAVCIIILILIFIKVTEKNIIEAFSETEVVILLIVINSLIDSFKKNLGVEVQQSNDIQRDKTYKKISDKFNNIIMYIKLVLVWFFIINAVNSNGSNIYFNILKIVTNSIVIIQIVESIYTLIDKK